MHPSFVDIQNELAEIAAEAGHLSKRLERVRQAAPTDAQDRWETTLICASAAEKLYTGCERVMARIAAEIDGSPVTHSAGWHAALLRRMANPFPGVRDAVISPPCHAVLNVMRAFRHRERNTYGIQLDHEVVVERAGQAVAGFSLLEAEVRAFYGRIDDGGAGTVPSSR